MSEEQASYMTDRTIKQAEIELVHDLNIQDQRSALAEACRFRLVRRSPEADEYDYYDDSGEKVCARDDWRPDWDLEQGLLVAAELLVIGEMSFQDDGDHRTYKVSGVVRHLSSPYVRGSECASANVALFDACLRALDARRMACKTNATA